MHRMVDISQKSFTKAFCWTILFCILIEISPKLVSVGSINNQSTLVVTMAWYQRTTGRTNGHTVHDFSASMGLSVFLTSVCQVMHYMMNNRGPNVKSTCPALLTSRIEWSVQWPSSLWRHFPSLAASVTMKKIPSEWRHFVLVLSHFYQYPYNITDGFNMKATWGYHCNIDLECCMKLKLHGGSFRNGGP